jgi:4-amino-4-deoxy-L-arabinose transferase-like glycosyltransferase
MQTMKKREIAILVGWSVILAIVVLLQSLPISPVYNHLEADSGVYAYVGSAILDGQLPYRDVWEQKPPVGFYLDALALLFGHTPWAIWWLNVLWVSMTCIAFFLIIKKMMGLLTGCLASLLFSVAVMQPGLFQGGNLMEVYGLFFQVLIIGAAFIFFVSFRNRWVFMVGVLSGLAFLTKQTTIALGFSSMFAIMIISLLRREFKEAAVRPLLFAGGFLTPVVLAASYWIVKGAGYDFLDAVFLHSLAYVGARVSFLWSLKNTVLNVFPALFISRLYYIAAGAFILYVLENYSWFLARLRRDRDTQPKEISPVELSMLGVFIALPLEITLASLGARNFGHYFLTLVPAGATVTAYIVWKTTIGIRLAVTAKKFSSLLIVGWLLLFLLSFFWLFTAVAQDAPTPTQLASIKTIFSNKYTLNELEQYIIKTTDPSDRVLVWHIHTGINFITKRKAAARVLFPFNLFISDWKGNTKLGGFIEEFKANPPELILVQKPNSAGLPFVDESLDGLCDTGCMPEITEALKQPVAYAEMKVLQDFFYQNYIFDKHINDWNIYRLIH